MKKHRPSKWFRSRTALVFTLPLMAVSTSFAKSARPLNGQVLTAQDEHTAAALKRVQQMESKKKITVSPAASPTSEHTTETEPGPAITKPVIVAEPAPKTVEPESAPAPVAAPESALAPAPTPASAPASTPTKQPVASATHNSNVNAEQALKWLVNGNLRYMKKNFRADGRSDTDRKRIYETQKAHSIILSCSDSRVPPEIVFDQALGEIFVVRTAAEALDASVIASLELAVANLGSRLLVVLGHTRCGTIEAAIKTKVDENAGSDAINTILADIRPRLKTVATEAPSKDLEVESALNADGIARDLVKRSDIIRRKVEAGELLIKTGLYRMDSGKVNFY